MDSSSVQQKVFIESFDPKKSYGRLPSAAKTGGIIITGEDENEMKELFKGLMKQLGQKIIEGQLLDITNVVKPVQMVYPKTFLEVQAIDTSFIPLFLTQASIEKDPLMRMKLFITGILASYSQAYNLLKNKVPIDSVIGETYQAEQADGSKFYAEQLSDDPVTVALFISGPNNCFKFYGQPKISIELTGVNQLQGDKKGRNIVEFSDGHQIQSTNPTMLINGILNGDRIINYINQMCFADKQNQMLAEIDFYSDQAGSMKKLTSKLSSWWSSSSDQNSKTSDSITIKIYKYKKGPQGEIAEKKEVSAGGGSWLEYIQFDNQVFWRVTDPISNFKPVQNTCMPSDSTFRQDRNLLKENKKEEAQQKCNEIYKTQTNDKKLRKANKV